MADESHVIRGINWRETFPFTQIFRAFRVAIHPSKLILALLALLALYAGGRVLDLIWPVQHRAVPREVDRFEASGRDPDRKFTSFQAQREADRKSVEDEYVRILQGSGIQTNADEARRDAKAANRLGDLKRKIIEERNKRLDDSAKRAEERRKAAKTDDEKRTIDEDYKRDARATIAAANETYRSAESIKGDGLFIQFFEYEVRQVNNVAWAVLANDWLSGFGGNAGRAARPGVLAAIKNFFVSGPWWLASQHTTYFILFLVLFSIIWAIFGGAICRIAAVHVARDEKISLSAALRFSSGKFLSFIFAPIIPLVIVLVVGLVVTLGALLGNIPFIGPILVGLLFFLALAAGFVMTLVLLGTAGGFNLMYPTIAVEGSDSFDAISRSFSYVYARPWRMLFYTLIALLYGALCFLFVRFFLAIMLMLTHHFVGAGMFVNVDSKIPVDLWETMWAAPTGQFTYEIDTLTLSGGQLIGAFFVALWVYLTIGMLGAFAISFYFSSNTIIYYLMRREVDATELDDVYLEQSEEDFGDTTATTTTTTTTMTAPATGGAAVFPNPGENPPPASPPPST